MLPFYIRKIKENQKENKREQERKKEILQKRGKEIVKYENIFFSIVSKKNPY